MNWLPSGKRLHNYGKSPFSIGKTTISMAMFNSYVTNYQRLPPFLDGKVLGELPDISSADLTE